MYTSRSDHAHRSRSDDLPAAPMPAEEQARPANPVAGLAPRAGAVAPLVSHWASDAGPAAQPGAGRGAAGAQVEAESGRAQNAALPPLGYLGPIGPYGPLGTLGPIGSNAWNPSNMISGGADWSDLSRTMAQNGGPLSEAGPLGPGGPVGDVTQKDPRLVPAPLQAGGDAAILGPLGPLGALGPLGPLGPVGAHGHQADADGNYRDASGKIVRDATVPYQGGQRTYGLVENYTEAQAKRMKDNDTSFLVSGAIGSGDEVDSYSFQADQTEHVSILLVPEKQLDAFDLTITDEGGKVLSHTGGGSSVDWVQLKVKAGTRLKAKVKLRASYHMLSSSYRLVVTGSGGYVKG